MTIWRVRLRPVVGAVRPGEDCVRGGQGRVVPACSERSPPGDGHGWRSCFREGCQQPRRLPSRGLMAFLAALAPFSTKSKAAIEPPVHDPPRRAARARGCRRAGKAASARSEAQRRAAALRHRCATKLRWWRKSYRRPLATRNPLRGFRSMGSSYSAVKSSPVLSHERMISRDCSSDLVGQCRITTGQERKDSEIGISQMATENTAPAPRTSMEIGKNSQGKFHHRPCIELAALRAITLLPHCPTGL